jgi:hypothetical protein
VAGLEQPGLFKNRFFGLRMKFIAWFSRNRHLSWFLGVLEMPMATRLAVKVPSIRFDYPDYCANLHFRYGLRIKHL